MKQFKLLNFNLSLVLIVANASASYADDSLNLKVKTSVGQWVSIESYEKQNHVVTLLGVDGRKFPITFNSNNGANEASLFADYLNRYHRPLTVDLTDSSKPAFEFSDETDPTQAPTHSVYRLDQFLSLLDRQPLTPVRSTKKIATLQPTTLLTGLQNTRASSSSRAIKKEDPLQGFSKVSLRPIGELQTEWAVLFSRWNSEDDKMNKEKLLSLTQAAEALNQGEAFLTMHVETAGELQAKGIITFEQMITLLNQIHPKWMSYAKVQNFFSTKQRLELIPYYAQSTSSGGAVKITRVAAMSLLTPLPGSENYELLRSELKFRPNGRIAQGFIQILDQLDLDILDINDLEDLARMAHPTVHTRILQRLQKFPPVEHKDLVRVLERISRATDDKNIQKKIIQDFAIDLSSVYNIAFESPPSEPVLTAPASPEGRFADIIRRPMADLADSSENERQILLLAKTRQIAIDAINTSLNPDEALTAVRRYNLELKSIFDQVKPRRGAIVQAPMMDQAIREAIEHVYTVTRTRFAAHDSKNTKVSDYAAMNFVYAVEELSDLTQRYAKLNIESSQLLIQEMFRSYLLISGIKIKKQNVTESRFWMNHGLANLYLENRDQIKRAGKNKFIDDFALGLTEILASDGLILRDEVRGFLARKSDLSPREHTLLSQLEVIAALEADKTSTPYEAEIDVISKRLFQDRENSFEKIRDNIFEYDPSSDTPLLQQTSAK